MEQCFLSIRIPNKNELNPIRNLPLDAKGLRYLTSGKALVGRVGLI